MINNQQLLLLVIISFTLVTFMFDLGVILLRNMKYYMVVKGLMIFIDLKKQVRVN